MWQEQGTQLWGLNRKEGTEESLLYFSSSIEELYPILDDLRSDVYKLAREHQAPTSLSIGMSYGPILKLKPVRNNRKQTVRNDPTRILAYKALRQAKRKGGNKIVIL